MPIKLQGNHSSCSFRFHYGGKSQRHRMLDMRDYCGRIGWNDEDISSAHAPATRLMLGHQRQRQLNWGTLVALAGLCDCSQQPPLPQHAENSLTMTDQQRTPPNVEIYEDNFPTPAGIMVGRFILNSGCLVFELTPRSERFRTILPKGSHMTSGASGQPDRITVGDRQVSLGELIKVGGGVAPWPSATPINCPTGTVIIGKILM